MAITVADLTVEWLGFGAVRLAFAEGPTCYIDPGRHGILTGDWEPDSKNQPHPRLDDYQPEDGDLVCITHDHHYDSDGIERVAGDDATVVVFEAIDPYDLSRNATPLDSLPGTVEQIGLPGELAVEDVDIQAIGAYNDPEGRRIADDGQPHHPKGEGVGYKLQYEDWDVLLPGDTDVLPGHRALETDVFLPPIGGNVTMNRHEAADLAQTVGADLVVPIHYNTHRAIETDDEAFAADVASRGIAVALDR